jgi:ribosomal-protein-alanine N-acetyltransferase
MPVEPEPVGVREDPAAPPAVRRQWRWYQIVTALLFIIFCFELGIFLLVFPWLEYWGLRISRAARSHLRRLLAIEREVFPEDAYPREMFLDLLADCGDLFFIASAGGEIAGYIVACAQDRKAELVSIATAKAYRRLGVGRALLHHTLTRLRAAGVTRVELMVRVGNTPAIQFYRRFGFRRSGRVRRYYDNGEDALSLFLRID